MENSGVCCNVCECRHYLTSDKCKLPKIEVTCEKTGGDVIANPHFCKSYQQK